MEKFRLFRHVSEYCWSDHFDWLDLNICVDYIEKRHKGINIRILGVESETNGRARVTQVTKYCWMMLGIFSRDVALTCWSNFKDCQYSKCFFFFFDISKCFILIPMKKRDFFFFFHIWLCSITFSFLLLVFLFLIA